PDLISPIALIAFAIVVSVNVSIFFAWSLTLDRTRRPMAYIGFSTDVPVGRVIPIGFAFGAAMVSLPVLPIAIGGTISFRWRMDGAMLQAAAVQMAVFPIAA